VAGLFGNFVVVFVCVAVLFKNQPLRLANGAIQPLSLSLSLHLSRSLELKGSSLSLASNGTDEIELGCRSSRGPSEAGSSAARVGTARPAGSPIASSVAR